MRTSIRFCGAAQRVTGSKHLITTERGTNILLDCGMFQGLGKETIGLNANWGFKPTQIDYVFLTHAHIDHSGLLPKLIKDGYKGKIYATAGTLDLCSIMLMDSARIQENDLHYVNKRRLERGQTPIQPLYEEHHAIACLQRFVELPLNGSFTVDDEITILTHDSGHIIGSVAFSLILKKSKGSPLKLFFSGDIGRKSDAILNSPVVFPQADYIICESTYGDRLHPETADIEQKLIEIVKRTCVQNKGRIIIPAFSVDRTQELIYALDRLAHRKLLPEIDVYVDSPLSVKATGVMAAHKEYFNKDILDYISKDGDPFSFPNLHYVTEVEESKKINTSKKPCIIISASGMAEAGRIKHHIKNNISNPANSILLVGYASPGSLAGKLKAGHKEVGIFGEMYPVRATVESMESFSAHADYNEMIDYLKCQDPSKVREVFLVHGEYDTQLNWAELLHAEGFSKVSIPEHLESIELR